jgi:methylamine dehydrogenase accessory protein MauD
MFAAVSPAWIVSMMLQWAMILLLSGLALSLMRQLGELAMRRNRMSRPEQYYAPFLRMPAITVKLANGGMIHLGGDQQKAPCLLVFFAATCGACELLPEAIKSLARLKPSPEFTILAVIDMERSEVRKYIADKALDSIPISVKADFPEGLKPSGVPFAVMIAADGRIAASGKPAYLSHLLEMADAAQFITGLPRQIREWGEAVPCLSPEQAAAG